MFYNHRQHHRFRLHPHSDSHSFKPTPFQYRPLSNYKEDANFIIAYVSGNTVYLGNPDKAPDNTLSLDSFMAKAALISWVDNNRLLYIEVKSPCCSYTTTIRFESITDYEDSFECVGSDNTNLVLNTSDIIMDQDDNGEDVVVCKGVDESCYIYIKPY